jgi:hypothetical protein
MWITLESVVHLDFFTIWNGKKAIPGGKQSSDE